MMQPEVWFPHMGIQIQELNPVAISIFGLSIYWYGVIIGTGVILALFLALREAKRTGQDPDMYLDFSVYAIILAVIGARIYYVLFSWENYKDNLIKIFAFREGGLAIYGAVIAAVITCIIFAKKRRVSFWLMADTAAPSLILGQAIGRWGNFVNQEAFGGYTDSFFAMRLLRGNVAHVTADVLEHAFWHNGLEYIQVHPTFLYESLWNFGVFLFLMLYRKHKRFTGEILMLYVLGYGLGRVWIEGLRTDQLLIGHTGIAVSQLVSAISIIFAIGFIAYKRKKMRNI